MATHANDLHILMDTFLSNRHDQGTFDLTLSEVSLAANLATLKDSSGRPSVSLSACHSEITKAKLHLSGGARYVSII